MKSENIREAAGHPGFLYSKPKTGTGHLFFLFLVAIFPFCSMGQSVPSFAAPDTACVNSPVNITNTSSGTSSYFWNFCVADVNAQPTAVNIGNPGNYLSQPVFSDIVEDNGLFYGFVTNHVPGGVTRLDYGNSVLNTPTAVFLGNIAGMMNPGYGTEGIQIVKANGKWYGVIVGGSPNSGANSVPRLITVYFGANINNPAPTAINWGNLGNMLQSMDVHLFQENGTWYGFTTNAENNTITRFNFTNSFDNPPTAVNLGNVGGLNYPTGVYAINDNGNWRVFVANAGNSTLSRLDFGTSLLNTPTGTNLGNPGNVFNQPRDLTIIKLCGQSVGFAVNTSNIIVRMNFSSLAATPTLTSLGNIGNLNFSHSLSKLFRVGNDIYSFITNVTNNTITRIKFSGCTSSSISNSTLQNPPAVTYNAPGTYNITLSVDDGLPTQNVICKQVVVVAPPVHSPTKTLSICSSSSLKIGSSIHPATYTWSTGAVSDSIAVTTAGTYWVESARFGCAVRDSFIVAVVSNGCDSIKITGADKICGRNDTLTYTIYTSPNCTQQFTFQADAAYATIVSQTPASIRLLFRQEGTTKLKVAYTNNCRIVADSMNITIRFSPTAINLGPDITSCRDTTITLHAGTGFTSYQWQSGTTDSTFQINTPGTYSVIAQNNCAIQFKDTLTLTKSSAAAFAVLPATGTACVGDSLQFNASGGTSYSWLPAVSFNYPDAASAKGAVKSSQNFTLSISDAVCGRDTIIFIPVVAIPGAQLTVIKSNDITCTNDSAILTATGASSYIWSPDLYISNNAAGKITVRPPASITYYVQGKNPTGCSGQDSISLSYIKDGDQKLYVPNAFTPNGNGSNDVFRPVFIGPALRYSFAVYNRWGQLIFKATTPKVGWDGTYHGTPQPGGTYVYAITAEGGCNGIFQRKGTFMLVR